MPNGSSGPVKPRTPPKNPPRPATGVGLRVSLIPAEEPKKADPKKGFRIWLVSVGVGLLALVILSVSLWVNVLVARRQVAAINTEIERVSKAERDLGESLTGARLIQSQLKGAAAVLKNHRHGSTVFRFFERYTLPTVSFSNATVAESGMVTLTAQATDYDAFVAQVNEIRRAPLVRSVTISGISAEYDQFGVLVTVRFTLTVNFDTAIFLVQAPEPATP